MPALQLGETIYRPEKTPLQNCQLVGCVNDKIGREL